MGGGRGWDGGGAGREPGVSYKGRERLQQQKAYHVRQALPNAP